MMNLFTTKRQAMNCLSRNTMPFVVLFCTAILMGYFYKPDVFTPYKLRLQNILYHQQRQELDNSAVGPDKVKMPDITTVEEDNKSHAKKLVIFYAYMRGGSSFLGNMVKKNKDVFYWYEPEWDIYNRMLAAPIHTYPLHVLLNSSHQYRKPTQFERTYLRDQLKNMLTCQVNNLTAEQLTSWTFQDSGDSLEEYYSCFENQGLKNAAISKCQQKLQKKCSFFVDDALKLGCHKFMMAAHGESKPEDLPEGFPISVNQYKQCIESIKDKISGCLPLFHQSCMKRKYKAIKLLRADLDSVEEFMKDWPDVKVVYQTRDPRGILTSRKHGQRQFLPSMSDEAPLLCQKMKRDLASFQKLEKRYPGKFFRTSYEDLASDPVNRTDQIYKFLDIPLPGEVKNWMFKISHANKDAGHFINLRTDSKATSMAWKNKLNPTEKESIERACKDVYDALGYEL